MRALVVLLALPIAACSGGGGPASTGESTDDAASTNSADTETSSGNTESTTAASGDDEDDSEDSGIQLDITNECGTFCDVSTPNTCPPGEKCTAVACQPGSTGWDTNVCRPIQGDGQVGEPCSDFSTDGYDDCAAGLMCWGSLPGTGLGHCTEFCKRGASSLDCPDGFSCHTTANGVTPICQLDCNPLAPDCWSPDSLCIPHPVDETFSCTFNASGGLHPYGTPCGASNTCNPGLVCVPAEFLPPEDCAGPATCCTPVCDLTVPNTCPGAADGQECAPFYEEPSPAGYEHVGICAVPLEP